MPTPAEQNTASAVAHSHMVSHLTTLGDLLEMVIYNSDRLHDPYDWDPSPHEGSQARAMHDMMTTLGIGGAEWTNGIASMLGDIRMVLFRFGQLSGVTEL